MAYVNVKDWSPDQVTDWLKGLDNLILPYINSFLNNEVRGNQLLSLRADDLEHLGVYTLGHQELILEAVEHLRNFHYELDKENLQLLALRLSCAANSLHKELLLAVDTSKVETQTMSDVANVITTIKPLICWLDRAPFSGQTEYTENKSVLLQSSIQMATCAQRDIFSDRPVKTIRDICYNLAKLADHIIQEISDPMILQPATLDLATLKKRENELGFFIVPSNHGIHQIDEIKYGSPAHASTKLEEGDEIVQVNYQTVVGWQRKKVLLLLQESPPDILLTLKKRPTHTKVYGQIYMKPYRLPSKKRVTPYSRWNDNLPSPRPELLTIPDLPVCRLPPITVPPQLESESSSDSDTPDSPLEGSGRVYPLKPRPVLQRRNTITGASPTSKRPHQELELYWQQLKNQAAYKHSSSTYIQPDSKFEQQDSLYLRDKSASCSYGLELTQRPTTVIGISSPSKNAAANLRQHMKKDFPEHKQQTTTVTNAAGSDSASAAASKKKVNFEDAVVLHDSSSSAAAAANNRSGDNDSNANVAVAAATESSNLDSEKSVSVNSLSSLSLTDEKIQFIDESDEITDRSNMSVEWQKEIIEEIIGTLKKSPPGCGGGGGADDIINTNAQNCLAAKMTDSALRDVRIDSIIKKFDQSSASTEALNKSNVAYVAAAAKPTVLPRTQLKRLPPPEVPQKPDQSRKPTVPPRAATTKVTRGRLDKSHSTPAYDFGSENDPPVDVPPISPNLPLTCTSSASFPLQNTHHRKVSTSSEEYGVEKHPLALPATRSDTIYGLGIPVVETINSITIGAALEQRNVALYSESRDEFASHSPKPSAKEAAVASSPAAHHYHHKEAPPVPPPRPSCVQEMPKPAYPSHSPKPLYNPSPTFIAARPNAPVALADLHLPTTTDTAATSNVFEYSKNVLYSSSCSTILTPKQKNFEPKMVSTPINKTPNMDFPPAEMVKTSATSSSTLTTECVSKSVAENKISPTNSVVRAMIYSSKNKAGKKKNNILQKRRKVTVKELSPGDIQGFLHQRLRGKHNQNVHWEKRWFVLSGSSLYGFKSKDALKAECLIFLTGFTVAEASEVKSRSHAFKVYHTGTCFYFSAENNETMTTWLESMTAATLHSDSSKTADSTLYSETDDSDTEKNKDKEKPTETVRKFGSLKKFTSRKNSDSSQSGSTSLDRKWFFNKSSSSSKQLPVPTAQFRSYRKVPNSATPLIISNNAAAVAAATPPQVTQSVTNIPKVTTATSSATSSSAASPASSAKNNLSKMKPINYIHASNPSLCDFGDYHVQAFGKLRLFPPRSENLAGFVTLEELMLNRQREEQRQNLMFGHGGEEKPALCNNIKPDVVYGEVPIRPTGDSRSFPDSSHNGGGGGNKGSFSHTRHASDCSSVSHQTHDRKDSHSTTSNSDADGYNGGSAGRLAFTPTRSLKGTPCKNYDGGGGGGGDDNNCNNNYENRTFPKTWKTSSTRPTKMQRPCYEDVTHLMISNAKVSEPAEFMYADKRSISKTNNNAATATTTTTTTNDMKERSYEMIHCPQQRVNDVQFAQNRTLDGRKYPGTPQKVNKIARQHSLNSADKKDSTAAAAAVVAAAAAKVFNRGESPEKFWLDTLRRNDKVGDKNACDKRTKLKSVTQYTPMSLPLSPEQKGKLNPKFAFELNLDDKTTVSNKGGKFKSFFSSSKQSGDERKEKTLLGSPRLHRAIFRKQNSVTPNENCDWRSDTPQMVPTTPISSANEYPVPIPPAIVTSPVPDYPGLEYPPVFEPETYSLSNPNVNLTLLRKQGKNV